jgi:hypothetical protein
MMAKFCWAQGNLVPNPSFEQYDTCPYSSGQAFLATPWITHMSSDYLNSCGTSNYNVPLNYYGYQTAHSGQAYCQMATFTWNPSYNYREFLQVQLLDTLEAGRTYCISFFVSTSENFSQYYCPEIGVNFSDTAIIPVSLISLPITCEINYSAQFENPVTNLIKDTAWTLVSGEYVAEGNEIWITIGNFKTDSNSLYSYFHGVGSYYSAVYIDDVSVTKKIEAVAAPDTSICINDSVRIGAPYLDMGINYTWFPSTGLSNSTLANPFAKPQSTTTYYLIVLDTGAIYCQGTSIDSITVSVDDCSPVVPLSIPTLLINDDRFFISSLPKNTSLTIYDSRGRLVFSEYNYQNEFSVINLQAGIYLYQLTLPDQTVQNGKFCVGQ